MIDVLLPYYGDVGLMKAAVRSIRGQTNENWHLIVVDDCYPDQAVRRWLAELRDGRIDYYRNDSNLGPNANYVKALSLARTPWFVMMGADDLMGQRFLEVVDRATHAYSDAAIITCRVSVIDEKNRTQRSMTELTKAVLAPKSSKTVVLRGERALTSILTGNWTYFPSLAWRRELVSQIGFRPGFNVVQDMALLVDVLAAGGSLVRLPDREFSYRRHAASDSARKTASGGARFAEEKLFFRIVERDMRTMGLTRAAAAARFHATSRAHALSLVPHAARAGDRAAVARLTRHAFLS